MLQGCSVAKSLAPRIRWTEMRCIVQHGAILALVGLLALVLTLYEKLLRLPLLLYGCHEIKLALQVLPCGPHRLIWVLLVLSPLQGMLILPLVYLVLCLNSLCRRLIHYLNCTLLYLDQVVHCVTLVPCMA